MKMTNNSPLKKLVLKRETVKKLTVKTGVRAGKRNDDTTCKTCDTCDPDMCGG
jgi:hypothetical protein